MSGERLKEKKAKGLNDDFFLVQVVFQFFLSKKKSKNSKLKTPGYLADDNAAF